MARPTRPAVSGNTMSMASMSAAAAMYARDRKTSHNSDRHQIAQPWQIEAYRHVNICGEARYAAALFAAIAGRAEIGVAEPHTLSNKPEWVTEGDEVEALAALAPTVRERTKLIRDYMLHRTIAGECYLIARPRMSTDPGYIEPPSADDLAEMDLFDPNFNADELVTTNDPVWEIVAVTELRKVGTGNDVRWSVKHDNDNYVELDGDHPVIRLWNPDPGDRREAWSPFRSLLPTLREIEWLTKHIFTQVRSRLMSAGVWFLPDNLTFPAPPADAIEGGAEAIATMNEAEQFALSLASSSMEMLEGDEVSFPSIVMADQAALAAVDQDKLIKFWSEIDDKAMVLRSDAVRRFSLGMDLPPEQVLGSSGLAVTGAGGSAGSVNHWGVWANEEQTISAHVEPALDDFTAALTESFLRVAVDSTDLVIGYDTATLRLRQDRSKEAIELYDRGLLNAKTTLRETGFDPEKDAMDDAEFQKWLLVRLTGGSATPEQVQAALALLKVDLPVTEAPDSDPTGGLPGRSRPRSLDEHPYEGPPREDHEHNEAPFSAREAAAEVLVLRALEKAGNKVLNEGKRGKDRDRVTPPHLAHVAMSVQTLPEFDFTLLPTVFAGYPAQEQAKIGLKLNAFCEFLYGSQQAYSRDRLIEWMRGV